MLATTLGIDFNPEKNWLERKQAYEVSSQIFKTFHISQSAISSDKENVWTTVVAEVVFIP